MYPLRLLLATVALGSSSPGDDVSLLQVDVRKHDAWRSNLLVANEILETLHVHTRRNVTVRWSSSDHPNMNAGDFVAGKMFERLEELNHTLKNARSRGFTESEALEVGKSVYKNLVAAARGGKDEPTFWDKFWVDGWQRGNNSQVLGRQIASWIISILELGDVAMEMVFPKFHCPAFSTALWLIGGIVELMYTEDASFPTAMNVLAQQLSTVGYGSDVPGGHALGKAPFDPATLRMFHSASVLVSTLLLDPFWGRAKELVGGMIEGGSMDNLKEKAGAYWDNLKSTGLKGALKGAKGALTDKFGADSRSAAWQSQSFSTSQKSMKAFAVMLLAEVVAGLAYWKDQGAGWAGLSTSLYMGIMTMTTVGYGDYSPNTPWGKFFSWLYMLITNAAYDWAKGIIAEKVADESGWLTCTMHEQNK